ncbi:MAG: hypothetical protein PHP42_01025 [Bacteroidota bacterium]|nr:hypothetical protein [Bacteroidota bacterium]
MRKHSIILVVLLLFLFNGCATLFKGYEDPVHIYQYSEDVSFQTINGVQIPVHKTEQKFEIDSRSHFSIDSTLYHISLYSNANHVLLIKTAKKEYSITRYPKLGWGWLVLDLLGGGVPMFIDIYTGAWNHFDPIVVQ